MAEICIYDGCYKHAWYNYPNETEKLYCKEHYKPDMVFKYFYICIDENCNRCAYYNTSDKMKKPEYCSMHKKDDMINVLTNRCIEEGCVKFPSFNFKTEKVSIYCSEHAHPNMINVHKARCKFISENGERCYNNPLWNFPNKTGLMYCKEHKEDGMICKTYQICAMDHCSKSASHNYKYEEGRLYCAEHALKGMINKKHATCIIDNCEKLASYNYKGNKRPEYCGEHADKTKMANVKNRICQYEDCIKRALFGQEGGVAMYCGEHRDGPVKNEVNVTMAKEGPVKKETMAKEGPVQPNKDIVNKKCEVEGCNGHRLFGFHQNTHCAKHKKEGMIRTPNTVCKNEDCKERAIYGIIGGKPMYCEEHKGKEKDLINLIEKKCKKCKLIEIMSKYEEDVCIYCTQHTQHHKIRKELLIKHLLDENNIKYDTHNLVVSDKICGKERPDFTFDMTTHMVILEVDEYQHSKYIKECENVRMYNITQSLGGIPVIWIRYNPDIYMVGNNKINTPDRYRHATLIEYLTKFVKDKPKNLAEVIYLYYNEYQKDNNKRITLIENES